MYIKLKICLSVVFVLAAYYTIHPITMKLWQVVDYTLAKVVILFYF